MNQTKPAKSVFLNAIIELIDIEDDAQWIEFSMSIDRHFKDNIDKHTREIKEVEERLKSVLEKYKNESFSR